MTKLKDKIYWLGLKVWDLETFHGHEMTTPLGTSYNSYLIKDKKTSLVDTCKIDKRDEYLQILEEDVGFENIDMIIMNHNEPDHGGMLLEILERIGRDKPVYCTQMGKKFINRFFGEGLNIKTVKTGDEISLGETTLRFIEMRMIHWPDSMMTYALPQKVLFSNDAFGQHFTAGSIFDDAVDECKLFYEALKYYVNILTPLGKLINKKLKEIMDMELEIDLIAPSHGVIWKKNIGRILSSYQKWSEDANTEKVMIIYDTMYGQSAKIAKAIAEGVEKEGVDYRIYNVSTYDTSDLITEMFLAKGVMIGGPTINNSILSKTAGLLEEMRSMKFRNKLGGSFGTYGWSGESCKIIKEGLIGAGLKVELDPISVFLKMSTEEKENCINYGRKFAKMVKGG
jgi:anaerobic nitric oxide reductase flavorubredoxin